jgi:hypothetical protein
MGKQRTRPKKAPKMSTDTEPSGINLNGVATIIKESAPPPVIAKLSSPVVDERIEACQSVATIIEDDASLATLLGLGIVPILVRLTMDPEGAVRGHALGTLRNILLGSGEEAMEAALGCGLIDGLTGTITGALTRLTSHEGDSSSCVAVLVEALLLLTSVCESRDDVVEVLSRNEGLVRSVVMCATRNWENTDGAIFILLAAAELLYVLTEENEALNNNLNGWARSLGEEMRSVESAMSPSTIRHRMLLSAIVANVLGQAALVTIVPLARQVLWYDVKTNLVSALNLCGQGDDAAHDSIQQLTDVLRSLNVFFEIVSNAIAECNERTIQSSAVAKLLGGPETGPAIRGCILGILTLPNDPVVGAVISFGNPPQDLEDMGPVFEVIHGLMATSASLLCNLSNVVPLRSVGFNNWDVFTDALGRDLTYAMAPTTTSNSTLARHIAVRIEGLVQLCLDVAFGDDGAGESLAVPRPLANVFMNAVGTPTARWVTPRVRTLLVSLVGICVQRDVSLLEDATRLLHNTLQCPILPVAWEAANVLMDLFGDEVHDANIAIPANLFGAMAAFSKAAPVRGDEWDEDEEAHMKETASNLKRFIVYKREMHPRIGL